MEYRLNEDKKFVLGKTSEKAKEYRANINKTQREALKLEKQINRLRNKIKKAMEKGKTVDEGLTTELRQCLEKYRGLQGQYKENLGNLSLLDFKDSKDKIDMQYQLGEITGEEALTRGALIDMLEKKASVLIGEDLKEEASGLHRKEEIEEKINKNLRGESKTVSFDEAYKNTGTTKQPEQQNQTPPEPKNQTPTQPKNPAPPEPKNQTPTQPKNQTPTQPKNPAPPEPKNPAPPEPKNQTPTQPKNQTPTQPKNQTPTQPKNQTPTQSQNQTKEQETTLDNEILENFDFSKLGVEGINSFEDFQNISDMDMLIKVLKGIIEMGQEVEKTKEEVAETEVETVESKVELTETEVVKSEMKVGESIVTEQEIEDNWLDAIDMAGGDMLVTVEDLRDAGLTLKEKAQGRDDKKQEQTKAERE